MRIMDLIALMRIIPIIAYGCVVGWLESVGSLVVYELDYKIPILYVVPIQSILGKLPVVPVGDTDTIPCACYEQNKHQGWETHRGYHVGEESKQLDQLGRSLTWTCGSWDLHTVFQPTRWVCRLAYS